MIEINVQVILSNLIRKYIRICAFQNGVPICEWILDKGYFIPKETQHWQAGFHGVMVSTQDSESCDPSSNLGGT